MDHEGRVDWQKVTQEVSIKAHDFGKLEAGINSQVGVNLERYRTTHQLATKQMAERLGVSTGQYRKLKSGDCVLGLATAARWSVISGAPIYCLFVGTPYEPFLPPYTTQWSLSSFYFLIGRLTDPAFKTLVELVATFSGQPFNADVHEWPELGRITLTELMNDLDENYYDSIGRNLRSFRSALGVSQTDIVVV